MQWETEATEETRAARKTRKRARNRRPKSRTRKSKRRRRINWKGNRKKFEGRILPFKGIPRCQNTLALKKSEGRLATRSFSEGLTWPHGLFVAFRLNCNKYYNSHDGHNSNSSTIDDLYECDTITFCFTDFEKIQPKPWIFIVFRGFIDSVGPPYKEAEKTWKKNPVN